MEIKRDAYLERLKKSRDNGMIKVVTGIRRSGKSYLLFTIFHRWLLESGVKPKNIIRLAFDGDENEELLDYHKLGEYVRKATAGRGRFYVLLDEIQFVEHFEKVLNGLNRNPDLDIYVTGSNSRFLSSDILTEFRGRGEEIRVRPLTFAEYLPASGLDRQTAWLDYLTYGGLPQLLSFDDEARKAEYLSRLLQETYIRDIVQRNGLRDERLMETLIDILSSSIGSLTNPGKIADTFKTVERKTTSDKTVSRYLRYLQEAYLVSEVKRYDVKGRRYIGAQSKFYLADVGLRNARLNFRQQEHPHILENVIYNELVARGYNVDVGVVEETCRTKAGSREKRTLEIDFVCNRGSDRVYIQSAYAMMTEEKAETEERPLRKVADSFRKVILVGTPIKTHHNANGTLIMNVVDFLLDKESLDKAL